MNIFLDFILALIICVPCMILTALYYVLIEKVIALDNAPD